MKEALNVVLFQVLKNSCEKIAIRIQIKDNKKCLSFALSLLGFKKII
jgi:hypothetical protein